MACWRHAVLDRRRSPDLRSSKDGLSGQAVCLARLLLGTDVRDQLWPHVYLLQKVWFCQQLALVSLCHGAAWQYLLDIGRYSGSRRPFLQSCSCRPMVGPRSCGAVNRRDLPWELPVYSRCETMPSSCQCHLDDSSEYGSWLRCTDSDLQASANCSHACWRLHDVSGRSNHGHCKASAKAAHQGDLKWTTARFIILSSCKPKFRVS
mmetsp:Transcript_18363/g.38215  ORF Transcript_18363/g.38215 Transcript_18363/m.38215 type:complete len:206 (+) Transcript_18363:412-1029(+)